jgi:hypothetical protein
VLANPKQFMEHVAIDEQQSLMAFSEGGFLCGQQSMSSMAEDIWSTEADMADMSTDLPPTAALPAVGSTAIDRTSNTIRIVRPRCMGHALSGR